MASLRSLTQNWKLKLLAFALAVLLWIVVSAEQVTSNWIPVPLQVVVADDDYVLAETPRAEVEVRFSGPGRQMLDLALRRPPLRLVISDISDTAEVVSLEPRMVQIPNQLAVSALDVNPSQVMLEFTRVATRSIAVAVRMGDELAPGWALADTLSVQPALVRITGPAARLDTLQRVLTAALSLQPTDSAFSRTLSLDTTGLRGLEIEPRTVRVAGRVERVAEREIADVPIDVGPGISVRPTQAQVTIRGPRSVVERVTPGELRVVVSIDSIPGRIPPEGLAVPIRVEHPSRFVRIEANPRTVRLYPYPLPGDTLVGVPRDSVAVGAVRRP